jgi:SAM-dependent methyltransferase
MSMAWFAASDGTTDPDEDAVVTHEHVDVPGRVREPVVVTFDGRYVWSFVPPRDGERTRAGWRVTWPEPLRPRLDGSTHVRVRSQDEEEVLLDRSISFRGNPEPLSLVDNHGHPLAVDRAGHLTRVFEQTDDEARRHVVEGAARALADLREKVGVEAHLSYGGLLGAVREGRMIGHDSDLDLAYLSRHTHPADIVLEAYRIEREMRVLGWKVVRMSGADLKLFVPLPDGRSVHVDVFGAFHVGDTFYQLGGRSGHLPREAIAPASTVTLEGVTLAAPHDPEMVLAFLYGPGWRRPDPAFQSEDPAAGLRRLDGWLRGFRTHLIEWNELFRYRRADLPSVPSTFALWVDEQIGPASRIIEIGTGNGRDAVHFAQQGHALTALDFSGAAIRQTRRKLRRLGDEPDVRVLVLNDLRAALLAGAELAREPHPPHVYARELLGCLDADARTNLWRLCDMTLRRGGSLFLEFAASQRGVAVAAPSPEDPAAGLVERLDPDSVTAEIEARGGRVLTSEVGPGVDFLDRPDPAIARMHVRWDRRDLPLTSQGAQMTKRTDAGRNAVRRAGLLPAWVRDLRASVQENRRLHRRVAELTDLVTELLVPLADRDEEKARALLERYRETTLQP